MTRAGIAAVLRFAERRTGLAFPSAQAELDAAAVRRAMERAGVGDAGSLLRLVEADAGACDLLLEELAIGETYFFREPGQLAFLRDTVVPELVELRRGGQLRAWSAACATGEEAYTLAMLLRDAGCPDFRVLGTDVVRSRLAAAERASYGRWSLRGVAPEAADRWFERADGRYRVRPGVRSAVEFRPLNLAEPRVAYVAAGAWAMDLVFCRNVLIYLDEATIRHVAERLWGALEPGGWLFPGASDPPLAGLFRCEVVQTGAGIAYRKPGRDALLPIRFAAAPHPPARPAAAGLSGAPLGTASPASAPAAPAPLPADVEGWVARVRTLADGGALAEAGAACAAAMEVHPAAPELLVLHSTLLFAAGRFSDAAAAGRRAVYLDRGSAVAHLALGSALARAGHPRAAARAFRNAAALLRTLPAGETVPASGGEAAARLLAVAEAQLHVLGEVA